MEMSKKKKKSKKAKKGSKSKKANDEGASRSKATVLMQLQSDEFWKGMLSHALCRSCRLN